MDDRLLKRLEKIETSIADVRVAEHTYLTFEANRKVLAAQLYLKAPGKNVAEKEAHVFASEDWINFARGHVEAESAFNHARRFYELRLKAYDAEHLTLKTEVPAIRRQA